jgi:Uma2 family endonuclease
MAPIVTTVKIDTVATSTLMTADELLRLSHTGRRYELVRGELKEMSPASSRHRRIAMRLGSLIEQYVRQHNLGVVYAAETGFKLRENPVLPGFTCPISQIFT